MNVRVFLMAFVVLLSACASTPPVNKNKSTEVSGSPSTALNAQRLARLRRIENWSFKGRAAVQRDNEGWSATLHWENHSDAYRLRIIAPLGRGTYEILNAGGKVSLIDPSNAVYQSNSPEKLLRESTGWELPISDIEYWVRGILAPNAKPTQLTIDEGGLLKDFAVSGWRVSVLEYLWVDSMAMPRKLFMSYGGTKMRLVISSWDLKSDKQ